MIGDMPMTETDDVPAFSFYVAAGSPTRCFLPSCHKPFDNTCFRGKDSHYYCSKECAELGEKMDLGRVEELRPGTPNAPPSPREKLMGKRS